MRKQTAFLKPRYNLVVPTTLDFYDLVRALTDHPEWREQLRQLLLTEEILHLPQIVRELGEEVRSLAEAQKQTEAQVRALAVQVERLTEAQRQTEEQVKALASEVQRLIEAQRRTEQRVEELAEAQRQLAEVQMHMERRLQKVEVRLDRLWGHDVERRYRERAAAYFGRLLTDVEALDTQALAKLLDEARKAGRISLAERQEILWADVVVRGEDEEGMEVAFLLEVSSVVAAADVERAKKRAELLRKALRIPVLPAVAGEEIPEDVSALCQAQGVWQLCDGRVFPPAGVKD